MDEITITDIIITLKKNFFKFFIIFLPLAVLFSCVVILQNKVKYESSYYTMSISTTGDEHINSLPKSFWFDKNVFIETLKRSGLENHIDMINEDFVSRFSKVSGEITTNNIIEIYGDDKSYDNFFKKVAIDSSNLKEVLNDLLEINQSYKTIYIEKSNLFLTKDEISIFAENWIEILNEKIHKNISFSGNLHVIDLPEFSEKLSLQEIIMLGEILDVALRYIKEIETDYPSFTTESLDIIKIRFNNVKDAINSIIFQNEELLDYIKTGYELEIEFIDQKVSQISNIMDLKDKKNEIDVLTGSDKQANLSGDAIESLINIGGQLANTETNEKYQNMLFNLEESKFYYHNELRRLMNSSIFISNSEVMSQIENELPTLINKVNELITNIEESNDGNISIELLTAPFDENISSSNIVLSNILSIIILSFLIAISVVILSNVKRN